MNIRCDYRPFALVALALLCASVPMTATANELFKCVDAAGVISIQSDPCPRGSTEAWRRSATPEPKPTPEQQAQVEARRQRDQQTVRELSDIVDRKFRGATEPAPVPISAPSAVGDTLATAPRPCEAAQTFAASVRDKEWLVLTEEQVRRIYGWVAEQCKLPDNS